MNQSDDIPEHWTDEQKALFTRMYSHMLSTQTAMSHPMMHVIPDEQWSTLCWNASWLAVIFGEGCPPLEHVQEDGRTIAVEFNGVLQ